jgi:putative endonuclease
VREPWFLYLLECRDGTLYAGVTRDMARRVAAHDAGRGARYTRGRGPVRVLAMSPPLGKSAAHRLEHWLKQRPRADKLAAIRSIGGRRPRARRRGAA